MTTEPKDQQRGDLQFPWKLHLLLEQAEQSGQNHIVSWLPSGRSFHIHDRNAFSEELMPIFFSSSKFKTFQRSLNLWGFETVLRGPEKGVRFHEHFVKGKPELCQLMTRVKVKGTSQKKKQDFAQNAALLGSATQRLAAGYPDTSSTLNESAQVKPAAAPIAPGAFAMLPNPRFVVDAPMHNQDIIATIKAIAPSIPNLSDQTMSVANLLVAKAQIDVALRQVNGMPAPIPNGTPASLGLLSDLLRKSKAPRNVVDIHRPAPAASNQILSSAIMDLLAKQIL